MEAEALGGEVLQQQTAKAEPERIAAGQEHHPLAGDEGPLQPRQQLCGPVTGQQLRRWGVAAPSLEIRQQTPGAATRSARRISSCQWRERPAIPAASVPSTSSSEPSSRAPAPLLAMMLPTSAGHTLCP